MKKWVIGTGVVLVVSAGLVAGLALLWQEEKTEITTQTISAQGADGWITEGKNNGNSNTTLQTESKVVYQSAQIRSPKPKANAADLQWNQTGSGDVHLEFRTYNGKYWSDWVHANDPETERPDNKQVTHKALVLADEIHEIQYRFTLSGTAGKPSPRVDVSNAQIELIDSTKGPSPTKQSPIKKFLGSLGVGQASAKPDGPRIYSRAEWGCPQPDSSGDWQPEYRKLDRAIVHHTATTMTSDPATMIRAVWQFHTYGNGWGDIGYNYLVDGSGNIYQGRYYDKAYAASQHKDVVGGHARSWNYGSTGVAALGNFTGSNDAPEVMLRAIGKIIAFKLSSYDISPTGFTGDLPTVVGHRDVLQTACPANVHKHLPSVRVFAADHYWHYNRVYHQDYAYVAQGKNGHQTNDFTIKSGQTAELFFDVRNTGADTWTKENPFPIRLGTKNPRDRASRFATSEWIDKSRPGSFTYRVLGYNSDGTGQLQAVNQILPGQVARFVIPIKTPEAGGTYKEYFQMVVERYSWFIRDHNMKFTIHVTPRSYAWHGISQKVYTDQTKSTLASASTKLNGLRAGQRYYVEAKIKNDGDQTWTNNGANPVRLGTFRPVDRRSAVCRPATWTQGCHRAATMEEVSVSPGATATFNFWVEMPYHTTDRQFKEYFNIVVEGRKWGPDRGMYWQFNVDAEKLNAHATSIAGYTNNNKTTLQSLADLSPNQRFYVEMKIRNDGNVIWKPTEARKVRLGTTDPYDRHSAFCDNTWLTATCNRLAVADESTVTPGSTGTYGFWMKAPAAPGTYTERVNLVAEGFSWFKNSNIPIVMRVR